MGEREDTTMQVDDADEQGTMDEENTGESLDSDESAKNSDEEEDEESTGESDDDEPGSDGEPQQSAEPTTKIPVEERLEHEEPEELEKTKEAETEQHAETSEEPRKEPVEEPVENSSEESVEELAEEPVEIQSDQPPVEEPAEGTSETPEIKQELEAQPDVVVEPETVSKLVNESGEKKLSATLVPGILKVRVPEGDEQQRKLFVGRLNKDLTTESDLKEFFQCYGKIIHISILRDKGSTSSKGFGFILFEETAAIDKIILDKKGGKEFIVQGNNLQVKRALPKVSGGGKAVASQDHFRKVFVGGLATSTTENDLQNYFKQFGNVDKVELLRDKEMQRSRGFAFVTFDYEDSADRCMQRRTHEISRKLCEVKRAKARVAADKTENDTSGRYSNNNSRPSSQHSLNTEGAVSGGRSMKDINQLIRQAFLRGVRSVQAGRRQAPAVASTGISGGLSVVPPNNALLEKLLKNRQAPSAQIPISPAPIPTPTTAPSADFLKISRALGALQHYKDFSAASTLALLKEKTVPHGRYIKNEVKHRYSPY